MEVSNYTLEVPLKQGDNELLIGIASPLDGWGLVSGVEDLNGITVQNTTEKKSIVMS